MEDELWQPMYRLFLEEHKRRFPSPQRRVQYNDTVILSVLAWAVLHDRPRCWACQMKNWKSLPGGCPWASLPSEGSLSRRHGSGLSILQLLGKQCRARATDPGTAESF